MPKHAVFIIAQDGFRDEELLEPERILQKRGIATTVAAPAAGSAMGSHGALVVAKAAIADVTASKIDAIIIIGGRGAHALHDHSALTQLIHECVRQGKVIGAICHGTGVLANAGAVLGHRATGHPEEEQLILDRGGEYTGMLIEQDDALVTAKDPSVSAQFGEVLAEAILSA